MRARRPQPRTLREAIATGVERQVAWLRRELSDLGYILWRRPEGGFAILDVDYRPVAEAANLAEAIAFYARTRHEHVVRAVNEVMKRRRTRR